LSTAPICILVFFWKTIKLRMIEYLLIVLNYSCKTEIFF